MLTNKAYLGDGVYAAFDGFGIVLTTEDGIRTTNMIVLEPEVIAELEQYVARLKERAKEQKQP